MTLSDPDPKRQKAEWGLSKHRGRFVYCMWDTNGLLFKRSVGLEDEKQCNIGTEGSTSVYNIGIRLSTDSW